jgi:tetratricopeptide (TPR) repeat protein
MIKAEFVEVRLTDEEQLGIKWRWKGAYDNYPLGATFRYPHQTRSESGQSAVNPGLSTLAAGMGIIFGSAGQEFRGIIDLLISEGKANLLSSPNIATLEGQEAKIDVGDEYPYETYVIEGGVKVPTIKFKTVGATLLVTPYIKGEKEVVLDIEAEVSEITGAPPFPTAPPIVGTRKAKTQISVDDGATIVIGGLLRETEKKTREGIPFLSRLPLFGSLFTYKTSKKEKTDLLVFITPYILPEGLEEENIVEKIKPLKVQIEELYQKGLDYKKLGDYQKAQECFEEVADKSRTYGFSSYLESIEKELLELEGIEKKRAQKENREKAKLEEERIRKEKIEKAKQEKERIKKAGLEKKETEKKPVFALAPGQWFASKDNNSFMIYEAQLRLKGSLRLFGGGGKSSEESSYIGYFGLRIGDKLNIGVGGINSSALEKTELMLSAGFSLGTDRVRLEGNYFYIAENEDVSGIRAALGIRF